MKASHDRGWFGIAALGLLAALLAWGAAREFQAREARQPGDRGSVFTSDASGARGLFLLLRSEGMTVNAMTRPATEAVEKGLMVVIDPGERLEKEESERIAAWLSDGGALVVAGENFGALGDALKVSVKDAAKRGLGLALPGPGQPRYAVATGSEAWVEAEHGATPLLKRGTALQAAEISLGHGRAVLVSDAFCATNAGLDAADNAAWWVETAKRLSGGRTVMFLETIHGHLREPSIPEYVQDRGWGPVVLQAILAGLALLWFLGSRPAPPLAPSTLIRRPVAEYAATMAHLYKGSHSEAHAASVALAELESLVKRPSWSRKLARMTAEQRKKFEDEAASVAKALGDLSKQRRPHEEWVRDAVARAATLRRSVTGDDAE